jgi:tetratricopeptide (TPR) repeat protein
MRAEDPSRLALRQALAEHLIAEASELEGTQAYEALVEAFAMVTGLVRPTEFQASQLPEQLGPLARRIVALGSPPGDEARVMSALLVLSMLDPSDPEHRVQYDLLTRWSREARATRANGFRNASELIDVWREHARLAPRSDVLELLASLHIARRDLVVQAASSERFNVRLSALSPHLIQRTPFDIAGLFLVHGDVEGAIARLRTMSGTARIAQQLLEALEAANVSIPDPRAAAALRELAVLYAETRPDVARGICRVGLRRHPSDGSFPACLARVAARQDDYEMATGWYAEAVHAEPDRRALYDEALSALNRFIEEGLFDADVSTARATATEASEILRAYEQRFPNATSPVRANRLEFLIGLLEMNSGHPEAALEHLQASVDFGASQPAPSTLSNPPPSVDNTFIEALIQLGLVTQRLGEPQSAVPILWRALEEMNRGPSEEINSRRPSLLGLLGDAQRAAGRQEQAENLYGQAAEAWTTIANALDGDGRALATAHRGVVYDKLGRDQEALADFDTALQAGPSTRPTYQIILSHLVTSSPRPELARRVFRTAVRELTLEPEWKVYFALWVQIITGQSEASLAADIRARLSEHARGPEWWSRLAAFGAEQVEADTLIEAASSPGERAEALFYAAHRRLAAGERVEALSLFEAVLETGMVNFHEYMMTLEVLPSLRSAAPSATP